MFNKYYLFTIVLIGFIQLYNSQTFTSTGFPVKVFSNTSPWNTPIPAGATVDVYSTSMINKLKASQTDQFIGFNYFQWTCPLYNINSSTFTSRINIYQPDGELYHNSVDPTGVGKIFNLPIPTTSTPDPQADGHMIVYDRQTTRFYEFSRFKWMNSTWAQATRYDTFLYDVVGTYPAFTDGGSRWWMRAVRGAGAPYIAGLIRWDEIQRGDLNHALAIALPNNRQKPSATVSYQYQLCSNVSSRTDGWVIGTDGVMEGARIRLNPSFNLVSAGITGSKATLIANTLKTYGAFSVDNGAAFALYFENRGGNSNSSPWATTYGSDITQLQNIPLDQFQVLDCATIVTK